MKGGNWVGRDIWLVAKQSNHFYVFHIHSYFRKYQKTETSKYDFGIFLFGFCFHTVNVLVLRFASVIQNELNDAEVRKIYPNVNKFLQRLQRKEKEKKGHLSE